MSNHLFVKALVFERNSEGEWGLVRANTNKGKFKIEQDLNDELFDKEIVDRFMSYVVQELKVPLEEFVINEEQEKTEG